MRRHLLPAILLLVSLACGAVALQSGAGRPGVAGADPTPPDATRPAAPLLTPRRVPAVVAAPLGQRRLLGALEDVWQRGPVDGSCLMVAEGGHVLFERAPDRPVLPASTMKLVTAAAILHHLDPDERLRTTVEATPAPVDGVVDDLWLVGGGDPVLGTRAWAQSFRRQPALVTPLEALADRVVAAGVREVRGRVVGDDGRYDADRYNPAWPERYIRDDEVGPLSGLTVNDGFARWEPSAVPFADPALGAAATFADLLRERGVVVGGGAGSGRVPADGIEVAVLESPTIGELVEQMVRESDNGTAELLLKELGLRVAGEGSTSAGRHVAAEALAARGLPVEGLRMVDGSGLDRENRLTCRLLLAILADAQPGGSLLAGLARAGADGTLAKRFVGTPVAGRLRAKTGSIRYVSSLAGVAEARGGTTLTFAYVLNGIDRHADAVPLQDALGTALVAYPQLPELEAVGPSGHPSAGVAAAP